MKVAVIGSGNMGTQLSAHLLHCSNEVVTIIGDSNRTEEVLSKIKQIMQKKYSEQYTEETPIQITENYSEIGSCDLIIETSKEDILYKQRIITKINDYVKNGAVVATNTSSISVTDLGKKYSNPQRFIGCHFFSPVSKMDLVEIVVGKETTEDTYHTVKQFVKSIGKNPVRVQDNPGFIVNRLLLPQINSSIKLLELGIATAEDIDLAVKKGLNHPMGPLELADYIGLDVCFAIMTELYEKIGEEYYRPANLLLEYVHKNKLGKKTGEGFYKYNN